MKILLLNRRDTDHVGGDMTQLRAYKKSLEKLGHTVDYKWELNPDVRGYDHAIMFHCNFGWNKFHFWALKNNHIPFSVVTIYYPNFYSDTDHATMDKILDGAVNIFCGSEDEAKEVLGEFPGYQPKVHLIDNGIDPTIFGKQETDRDDYVLCASGREGKGEKEVEEACKELGLPFKYVTRLSQEELAEYYCKCRVYVCGSDSERNNIMILEAASCGATVVDSTGNRGRKVHDFKFWANPRDKEDLKHAIESAWSCSPLDESSKVKTWDEIVEHNLLPYISK